MCVSQVLAVVTETGVKNLGLAGSSRGGGTGPADLAAAGPIMYGEITTKDDLTT